MHSRNDRNLRVAFDHQIFVLQEHGGISRYFARLAEHLPEFGVDAKIISPLYFTNLLTEIPQLSILGRHVSWSPRKRRTGELLGRYLHALVARKFGADIIHETYFQRMRLAPRRSKVVLTVYDMTFELMPNLPDAETEISNKKIAVERADAIICISESTRRDLLKFYPEVENKTSVVLFGFDRQFASEAVATPPHARPYILFVGIRRDYKNFDGLLNAYAKSERIKCDFDIVCVGHQPINQSEADLIESLGLRDRVHHRVAHDDAALRSWYAHAALFAYPSLYEGFGIPPLEAMAANCPVVCVKISSMPEVCGDAAEYVDPEHPETLLNALENVLYSPARADELRRAGRDRISHFSWRECARQTHEVYKSLR